jgi:hypothetical protein
MSPEKIARSRRSTIKPSNRSISFDDKGLKGRSDCEIFLMNPPKRSSRQDDPRAEVGHERKHGREGTKRSARLDRFIVLVRDGVSLGVGSYGCQAQSKQITDIELFTISRIRTRFGIFCLFEYLQYVTRTIGLETTAGTPWTPSTWTSPIARSDRLSYSNY